MSKSIKSKNALPKTRVPSRTGFIACGMLQDYIKDRTQITGMKEARNGLDPAAYGIGTILTFRENKVVTVPAETYRILGHIPTAQEEVSEVILPRVGVVAPIRISGQTIVGFHLSQDELSGPELIPKPDEPNYHFRTTDEKLGISTERFYDNIMIAREIPIGGFKLRHYLSPGDLGGMAF